MRAVPASRTIYEYLQRNPALPAVLAFALALRIASIFFFPSLHHPDELYQVLEQGHRLAFGYGVIPWEFEDGVRSYFMPLIFAALMRSVAFFSDLPASYVGACHIALAVLSVVPIISLYKLGLERSLAAAIIASTVYATSFEAIYFASRTLSEAVSSIFLITAISEASRSGSGRSRQILIGFLLAFALFLRVQFGPAVAFVVVYVLQSDGASLRNSVAIIKNLSIGALGPILIFGLCDAIFWGAPFASYVNYVNFNFFKQGASNYGVEPGNWYIRVLDGFWGGSFLVLGVLAFLSTRNHALFFRCGLVILATHSFIPHKEYRFVFATDVLFLIGASLFVAQSLDDRIPDRGGRRYAAGVAAVLAAWVAGSGWLALGGPFSHLWRSGPTGLGLQTQLRAEAELCGLFVRGVPWWRNGGYTYLHRNVPLYFDDFDGAPPKAAYNYEIASLSARAQIDPAYSLAYCLPEADGAEMCVWRREGTCVRAGGPRPILERKRLT